MKRMVFALLTSMSLLALVGLPACTRLHETGGLTSTGVIFSAEQTQQAVQDRPYLGLAAPYWTPTAAEVAQLESEFPAYLRSSSAPRVEAVIAGLDRFKRQYLGYTAAGRKTIFVNGFCDSFWANDQSWRTRVVLMLDGGACFFQGQYDLGTSTFDGLSVNGEA